MKMSDKSCLLKSGLRRAGCLLTAGVGDHRESATESKPPVQTGKGETAW